MSAVINSAARDTLRAAWPTIVQSIAAALGATVKESEEQYATLQVGVANTIDLHLDSYRGRIESRFQSPSYLDTRGQTQRVNINDWARWRDEFKAANVSISSDAQRAPAAIAADIKRRLLEHGPTLALYCFCLNYAVEQTNDALAQRDVHVLLGRTLGEYGYRPANPTHSSVTLYGSDGLPTLVVQHGGRVRFEAFTCDAEKVAAVIKLLAE